MPNSQPTQSESAAADHGKSQLHPVVLCYVTAPSNLAPTLAQTWVEKRLAACINLLPAVQSIYHWEGQVERDSETMMIIKTRADRVDALRAAVLRDHPYELPEFLVVPVLASHEDYLQWVHHSVE